MLRTNNIDIDVDFYKTFGIDVAIEDNDGDVYYECDKSDWLVMIEHYKKGFMYTKQDIVTFLEDRIARFDRFNESIDDDSPFKIKRACRIRLYKELYAKVKNMSLFDAPLCEETDCFWYYDIVEDDFGISLSLAKNRVFSFVCRSLSVRVNNLSDKESYAHIIDTILPIARVDAPLLSVSDYYSLFEKRNENGDVVNILGITKETLRQYIRRGKIHSCKKCGTEWRISELTRIRVNARKHISPIGDRYFRVSYADVKDLDISFRDCINDYNYMILRPSSSYINGSKIKEARTYRVIFRNRIFDPLTGEVSFEEERRVETITASECERLNMYFTGNEAFVYLDRFINSRARNRDYFSSDREYEENTRSRTFSFATLVVKD